MQIKSFILRLKNPSVILSILSQIIALLLLFGFKINENIIMSVAAIACSILTTLGILSNPDTKNKGYGDDIITCSECGKSCVHCNVNGQMICSNCGTVCTSKQ